MKTPHQHNTHITPHYKTLADLNETVKAQVTADPGSAKEIRERYRGAYNEVSTLLNPELNREGGASK
jgi:hypothetical protein